MTNDKNTYSTLTQQEWYNATGELIKPNSTLIYDNEFGGEWYIKITE